MKIPNLGDSISDAKVLKMHKQIGEFIQVDEIICDVETDKLTLEIKAPEEGTITNFFAKEEEVIDVGADFMEYDPEIKGEPSAVKSTPAAQTTQEPQQTQTPQKTEAPKETPKPQETKKASQPVEHPVKTGSRNQSREPLSRMRQRTAERLKESQNTNATLTTFNELDMSEVMALRSKFQEEFVKKYGIKMGFMSFFLRASTMALQEMPIVNSVIDGKDVIHRDYVDISVAVATPKGLVVPVIRNCESKSLADFETTLRDLSVAARDNKIKVEDMVGGNFSISNGGVYGSMMGTPIINPPQTAILGMHNIVNRPMVRGSDIVARPMMYLALSYDHRLIDGREGVLFLKKIRDLIEEPRKMLLNI